MQSSDWSSANSGQIIPQQAAQLSVNQVFHPHVNTAFPHHGRCSPLDALCTPSVWAVEHTHRLCTSFAPSCTDRSGDGRTIFQVEEMGSCRSVFIVCPFAQTISQVPHPPARALVLEQRPGRSCVRRDPQGGATSEADEGTRSGGGETLPERAPPCIAHACANPLSGSQAVVILLERTRFVRMWKREHFSLGKTCSGT